MSHRHHHTSIPLALIAPLALSLAALSACSSDERPSEELCPSGTIRVNGSCIRPDGGTPTPDTGVVGEDATTSPDAEVTIDGSTEDAGQVPADGGGGGEDAQPAPDATIPDSGIPTAVISGNALDFGRIVLGTSASLDVVVENRTTDVIRIRSGFISGGAAADYAVTASSTITPNGIVLNGGDRVTFTFTFTPRAAGSRVATLDLSLCESGCDARVTLAGVGLLDAIECLPTTVDFAAVSPGQCALQSVTCANASSVPATVHDWSLAASTSAAFTLGMMGVEETLAPADTLAIDVMYCPTAIGLDSGTLELDVDNPDPTRSPIRIVLSGIGGGPELTCAAQSLDFGLLAVNASRSRTLTCTNTGNAALNVVNVATTAADVALTQPASSTLAPGDSWSLDVAWTPSAAATLAATLTITTDDLDTPTLDVALTGQAVDSTGCALAMEPASLDFGAVRVGRTQAARALVHNTGTGPCLVVTPTISGPGLAAFAVAGNNAGGLVAAGATLPFELAFAPRSPANYSATFAVTTSDVMHPQLSLPLLGSGVDLGFALLVEPSSIDFGTLVGGCVNPAERAISVRNLSNAALTVTVSLDAGTPAAFSITPAAPATLTIAANSVGTVTARFLPSANGSYSGRYRVDAPGLAPVYVSAAGSASTNPHNVMTFSGSAAQVTDLLFIVDDSGSMAEEQARLQVAAQVLLDRGDLAGADYHIGVTTTDPGPSPTPGVLRGNPTYVTPLTANKLNILQNAINAGTNGSGTEEGLFTATEATTNTTRLSGSNAGFLRSDGELAVIIISDEEDQSPDPVADYVSAMQYRPIGVPGALRIFAITGGNLGCTSAAGNAEIEVRYSSAAALTGGFVRSICSADYTPILTEIADTIYTAGRSAFTLASRPRPGSVTVTVDGVAVPASDANGTVWGVDYVNGRVVFLPGHVPAATSTVEIGYDAVCTAATCGDGMVQAPEACDDGNATNTDACPSTCQAAACGDGFVAAGIEQCDDGNTLPGDGCNPSCIIEGCGNGILEAGEQCDNGPLNSDTTPNACRSNCVNPACHDGVVDTGEACDDGNTNDLDACVGACVAATCGDGFVRSGVEQCDDANTNNADACSNTCTLNTFGFTVSTMAAPFVATPGTAMAWMGTSDDGSATVPIGFPFSYLGVAVTNVYPATNGFVSFFGGSTAYTNTSLPTNTTPNGLIAWWWDDLNFGISASVGAPVASTALIGTAPNRIRVLSFLNVQRYGASPTASSVNAEVWLYETTNVIEVHYGAYVTGTTPTTFSASVGWESADGMTGANALACTSNCVSANWPTNTIIRYTP